MSGPRTKPSPLPPKAKKGKKGAAATPVSDQVQDAELGQMEANVGQSSSLGSNKEEEVVVLTDKEEAKLRKALRRFSKSQTWCVHPACHERVATDLTSAAGTDLTLVPPIMRRLSNGLFGSRFS